VTSTSLAGILAGILAAVVWLRLWWAKRQTAAQRARAERAEGERDAAASERDRAQLQEAATASHAADQARGFEAAGEIHADATGKPDADRAALYDRMRDSAHRRREGAGAGDDAPVRAVPRPGATGGHGAGD
jgi:hypothetical protein